MYVTYKLVADKSSPTYTSSYSIFYPLTQYAYYISFEEVRIISVMFGFSVVPSLLPFLSVFVKVSVRPLLTSTLDMPLMEGFRV